MDSDDTNNQAEDTGRGSIVGRPSGRSGAPPSMAVLRAERAELASQARLQDRVRRLTFFLAVAIVLAGIGWALGQSATGRSASALAEPAPPAPQERGADDAVEPVPVDPFADTEWGEALPLIPPAEAEAEPAPAAAAPPVAEPVRTPRARRRVEQPAARQRGRVAWRDGAVHYEREAAALSARRTPLLLYFHADWCGVCRSVDGQLWSDHAVTSVVSQEYVPIRIAPEAGAAEARIAASYGVRSYPTILVVPGPNEPLQRVRYAHQGRIAPPDQFAALLRQIARE